MKSTARKQFDSWADTYDRSLLQRFLFQPSYRVLMQEIARWRRTHDGPFRVLDIGCGTGQLVSMLAGTPWPVHAVGLDYAPSMCAQAGQNARQQDLDLRAQFTAGDSEFLPFADGSFDVVTCSNSFHHYPHQPQVVGEVRRLLRPGGRFILIDGFRDNVVGWVVFDVIIPRVEGHVHHAPWHQIDAWFHDAGFANIHRRKFNFWMPLCATIGDVPKKRGHSTFS